MYKKSILLLFMVLCCINVTGKGLAEEVLEETMSPSLKADPKIEGTAEQNAEEPAEALELSQKTSQEWPAFTLTATNKEYQVYFSIKDATADRLKATLKGNRLTLVIKNEPCKYDNENDEGFQGYARKVTYVNGKIVHTEECGDSIQNVFFPGPVDENSISAKIEGPTLVITASRTGKEFPEKDIVISP